MPTEMVETIGQFQKFIARGKALMAATAPAPSVEQFRRYVAAAKLLLLRDLPKKLAAIQPELERLHSWLVPLDYDLLSIVRVTNDEDAYTNLIAWCLGPKTHPESAIRRQRAWLSALQKIPETATVSSAVEPKVRLYTDDGFPDLVLRYPHFVVVVEAKTGTEEHAAPSGLPQSEAHPLAVQRKFCLNASVPVYMIFLTLSGWSPANKEAITTTYRDFALALAKGLAPGDLPDDLRPLFKLIITHLLTGINPAGGEVSKALNALAPLLATIQAGGAEKELLANLAGIDQLLAFVPKEDCK